MTKLASKWNYPTAVRFGAGRICELPDALRPPASEAAASSPMPGWPSCPS